MSGKFQLSTCKLTLTRYGEFDLVEVQWDDVTVVEIHARRPGEKPLSRTKPNAGTLDLGATSLWKLPYACERQVLVYGLDKTGLPVEHEASFDAYGGRQDSHVRFRFETQPANGPPINAWGLGVSIDVRLVNFHSSDGLSILPPSILDAEIHIFRDGERYCRRKLPCLMKQFVEMIDGFYDLLCHIEADWRRRSSGEEMPRQELEEALRASSTVSSLDHDLRENVLRALYKVVGEGEAIIEARFAAGRERSEANNIFRLALPMLVAEELAVAGLLKDHWPTAVLESLIPLVLSEGDTLTFSGLTDDIYVDIEMPDGSLRTVENFEVVVETGELAMAGPAQRSDDIAFEQKAADLSDPWEQTVEDALRDQGIKPTAAQRADIKRMSRSMDAGDTFADNLQPTIVANDDLDGESAMISKGWWLEENLPSQVKKRLIGHILEQQDGHDELISMGYDSSQWQTLISVDSAMLDDRRYATALKGASSLFDFDEMNGKARASVLAVILIYKYLGDDFRRAVETNNIAEACKILKTYLTLDAAPRAVG